MSRNVWLIGIAVVLGLFIFSGINTIPTLDEKVNASWAEVQNQYQRRMDLIPNLVATVKGYANFEQKTLTDVINARANATKVNVTVDQLSDQATMQKFEAAQGALTSSLSRLM